MKKILNGLLLTCLAMCLAAGAEAATYYTRATATLDFNSPANWTDQADGSAPVGVLPSPLFQTVHTYIIRTGTVMRASAVVGTTSNRINLTIQTGAELEANNFNHGFRLTLASGSTYEVISAYGALQLFSADINSNFIVKAGSNVLTYTIGYGNLIIDSVYSSSSNGVTGSLLVRGNFIHSGAGIFLMSRTGNRNMRVEGNFILEGTSTFTGISTSGTTQVTVLGDLSVSDRASFQCLRNSGNFILNANGGVTLQDSSTLAAAFASTSIGSITLNFHQNFNIFGANSKFIPSVNISQPAPTLNFIGGSNSNFVVNSVPSNTNFFLSLNKSILTSRLILSGYLPISKKVRIESGIFETGSIGRLEIVNDTLEVAGEFNSTLGTLVLNGNTSVNGSGIVRLPNLEVYGSTILNATNLRLRGNLFGGGFINSSANPLILDGAATQTIGGSLVITRLHISNTSDTAIALVNAFDDIQIANQLISSIGSGLIQTGGRLTLTPAASYLDLASTNPSGGSIAGNLRVQKTGASNDWNLWASPGRSISWNVLRKGYLPQIYTESVLGNINQGWSDVKSGSLITGKGYSVYNGGNIVFSGSPNNGTINLGVTLTNSGDPAADGWNLIGNPYPSGIDKDAFLAANSTITTEVHIWDQGSGSYIPWNGSSGVQTIPSCQGFFIFAAQSGNIVYNNAMRTGSNTALFRLAGTETKGFELFLERLEDGKSDRLKVNFDPRASKGFDQGLDARKLPIETEVYMFSRFRDRALSILALPEEIETGLAIPLDGSLTKPGAYRFRLETNLGQPVYLEDKLSGKWHDLNDLVDMELPKGTISGRFSIHFDMIQAPSTSESLFEIVQTTERPILKYTGTTSQKVGLELFGLDGRNLITKEMQINTGLNELNLSALKEGYYIIRITGHTEGSISQRCFLKQP